MTFASCADFPMLSAVSSALKHEIGGSDYRFHPITLPSMLRLIPRHDFHHFISHGFSLSTKNLSRALLSLRRRFCIDNLLVSFGSFIACMEFDRNWMVGNGVSATRTLIVVVV